VIQSEQAKDNPNTIRAWAFFDWANSAYSLVITVAIFPPYFYSIADDMVKIGAFELKDTTLFTWSISLAYLIIAIISPILSGIADYGGRKMYFMRIFTVMGSLACMTMLFFTGMATLWLGVIAFMLATIGFAGGIVFNNAYLPQIASRAFFDRVSAKGYIYGFIGSVILLLINLLVIIKYEWFGFSSGKQATPVAFVMVGLWWLGFAQIPFRRLPPDTAPKDEENLVTRGYRELRNAWNILRRDRYAKLFLVSFFLYNAAVQAVLFLASTFADKELHFDLDNLILLILILQIVAIGGAWLFSRVSDRLGNRISIGMMLLLWTIICFLAYSVDTGLQFYILAGGVGLVMGGTQSLSRSTYAKFLPEATKDNASFFSFYDVMDKTSTVFGTFLFGLVEVLTGNMRTSILALSVCFLLSLIVLYFVRVRRMEAHIE
jgi:MFS transporter, UMF1 family